MTIRSWIHNLFARTPRPGTARPRPRVRLSLEALEGRLAPAVITVTSLADNTLADGQVSLREAVQAANTDTSVDGSVAGSGADTIVFASSLAGQTITLTQNDPNLAFGPTALVITSDVTIDGSAQAGLTISGGNARRDFAVGAGATLTLKGLTVTGGN